MLLRLCLGVAGWVTQSTPAVFVALVRCRTSRSFGCWVGGDATPDACVFKAAGAHSAPEQP